MLYQHAHFGTSDYFCKEYGENFSFPMHLHNSFEFITVLSGEMTILIDDVSYTLKAGKSVLIFPNQLHSLESQSSHHMLCIFSQELVRAYYSKISKKIPVNHVFSPDDFFIRTMDALSPDASVIEKKGLLYCLCAQFDKTAHYISKSKVHDNLLRRIFIFVEENFSHDCDLLKLSRETGYSYSYISRCFKKSTGITFNTYVNHYRISHACYLLNNTTQTILQCAMESGFSSLRSFNRNFTEVVGVTPSAYRKKDDA